MALSKVQYLTFENVLLLGIPRSTRIYSDVREFFLEVRGQVPHYFALIKI